MISLSLPHVPFAIFALHLSLLHYPNCASAYLRSFSFALVFLSLLCDKVSRIFFASHRKESVSSRFSIDFSLNSFWIVFCLISCSKLGSKSCFRIELVHTPIVFFEREDVVDQIFCLRSKFLIAHLTYLRNVLTIPSLFVCLKIILISSSSP